MDEATYKVKHIFWPPWAENGVQRRSVPILLQDVNGPCPLIALANVLLLRGTLNISSEIGEVTQARTVQMLAEHLLDSNFSQSEGNANLQHNLSDAISLLPKLTTGIDVNVRFDGIRSIEFTGETAVFDLLGIDLVHGWLCDPQDKDTAVAIASRSYNEVVLQIVSALGGDATPAARSSAALSRRSTATIANKLDGSSSIGGASPKGIDADALSAALESTLKLTNKTPPPSAQSVLGRTESSMSGDSMASAVNLMLRDTVKEAFRTPPPSFKMPSTVGPLPTSEETPTSKLMVHELGGVDEPSGNRVIHDKNTAVVRDALLAREFLETNPSQLTVFGLSCLMEGMQDKQLAVFFRNNHFNVVLRYSTGLYILVTDQGYLYESDIVWEHLNNVDGDTQLLDWKLQPFSAHATGNVDLLQQKQQQEQQDVHAAEPTMTTDSDYALAMQLQEEERHAASQAQQARRRQQQQEQVEGQQTMAMRPGQARQQGERKKKSLTDCSIM